MAPAFTCAKCGAARPAGARRTREGVCWSCVQRGARRGKNKQIASALTSGGAAVPAAGSRQPVPPPAPPAAGTRQAPVTLELERRLERKLRGALADALEQAVTARRGESRGGALSRKRPAPTCKPLGLSSEPSS